MAQAMRLTRPWLLPSALPIRQPTASPILVSLSQKYSTRQKSARERTRLANERRQRERNVMAEDSASPLFPMTLVTPPLKRFPRKPSEFINFAWLVIKNRFMSLGSTIGIKVMAQPKKFRSRSRFQFGKKGVVPSAVNLHRQMSEAVASGDKMTLFQICTPELATTLAGAIDTRPSGQQSEWELVKYLKPWMYPRIADWRVSYQPSKGHRQVLRKQAVVTIASIQRVTRKEKGEKTGSSSQRTLVEHLVLQSDVDPKTYQSSPWRVWGTLREHTYKTYLDEVENIAALTAMQQGLKPSGK
ncbi:hypothetical protein F5Y15DRAFT_369691 [Xylariaceae sp. FL0016]|nr:hypothetical protein F5Y15DRAFT_369691 [Xylariaceae sp. FL0016]